MKYLIYALGILVLALFATEAEAVCGGGASSCFVRAAGGNSNDATASGPWSTTSGGSACSCVPAATDNVFLDGSSGQLTINAALSINNLDATGYAATLTHNSGLTLTVAGTVFKFNNTGMTYTAVGSTRIVAFTGAAGPVLVTTAGRTMASMTVNVTAGVVVQLQDDLAMRNDSTLTVTQGTFDANNKSVLVGLLNSTGVGSTRVITFGTGPWTIYGTALTVIDFTSAAANLTLNTTGSSITVSAAPTSARTINLGTSKTYNNFTINKLAGGAAIGVFTDLAATTGATFNTLTVNGPIAFRMPTNGNVFTATNININGIAFDQSVMVVPTTATTATLTASGTCIINYATIFGMTFGGTCTAATNSFDIGNNTGIAITGPSGGGGGHIIGG